MTIKTKQIYTIDDHPNPEKVIEWVRDNWHDLGQHVLDDALGSLKAFAKYMCCTLDYSFGIFPDRGEYIKIKPRYWEHEDLKGVALYKVWNADKKLLDGKCVLTGYCYDETLIDAIRNKSNNDTFQEILDDAGQRLMKAIHGEGEYLYSDEGIRDCIESNEYYFNLDGSFSH